MPRLALYFFDKDTPQILDTDSRPIDFTWRIGRSKDSEIRFLHPTISRVHAAIRCRSLGVGDLAQWEIMTIGANPSYRSPGDRAGAETLPLNEWVGLKDGDQIWFVVRDCGFIATTEIDETLDISDDDATQVNAAPPPPPPETSDTWASVVRFFLNGPDGIPRALWWLMLLVVAILIALIKYR